MRKFTVKIKGGKDQVGTLGEATGIIQTQGAAFALEGGVGYTLEEIREETAPVEAPKPRTTKDAA